MPEPILKRMAQADASAELFDPRNTKFKQIKDFSEEKQGAILREITDHIVQCLHRIEDDIEFVVFLRKNDNLQQVSQQFYLSQIDRFSRDTLIAFNQIIDNNSNTSSLRYLIRSIKDVSLKKKMESRFQKLKAEAKIVILHRNKVVAHHETAYNFDLGDYYPTQLFGYLYCINPCMCNRLKIKFEKLFWRLKQILNVDGVGMRSFGESNLERVFKKSALGKKTSEKNLEIIHKCRYKDCLLK